MKTADEYQTGRFAYDFKGRVCGNVLVRCTEYSMKQAWPSLAQKKMRCPGLPYLAIFIGLWILMVWLFLAHW